jgi:hypothetical protein
MWANYKYKINIRIFLNKVFFFLAFVFVVGGGGGLSSNIQYDPQDRELCSSDELWLIGRIL